MSRRLRQVKEIYKTITDTITSNRQEWIDFLKFAAGIYKYNFDNTVLIYAQRPDASMVASMEIWNRKLGRYVNKGTRSIAVFDTSKPTLELEYLFDVKDTNGAPHTIPALWKLNSELSASLVEKFKQKNEMDFSNIHDVIEEMSKRALNDTIEDDLIDFESDVSSSWLKDLPLDGVKSEFSQLAVESIIYMTACRCGIEMESDSTFKSIEHFNSLPLAVRLGNIVCNTSQQILREIESEVKNIKNEQRSVRNNETGSKSGIHGSGRDTLPEDRDLNRQGSGQKVTREIRTDENELPERESSKQVQLTISQGRANVENASDRRGSTPEVGTDNKTDDESRSNTLSARHDGKPSPQRENTTDSGGNSPPRDSLQVDRKETAESLDGGSFLMPEKINYRYSIEDEIGIGGLKTKFRNNVEAIKTLKVIEEENRSATADEQKILAKYAGWGGMPQVFDINNSSWSNEYAQLKELLTSDEYNLARASTPNAHFTSHVVIESIYKALDRFGFKDGNILEPSLGVGNFFSMLPKSMANSRLYGVELDDLSGRMARQLYQNAEIRI